MKGIGSGAFAAGVPLAEAARLARMAGFAGFEPALGEVGELSLAADQTACRSLGEAIRGAGMEIVSLGTRLFRETPFTAPEAGDRARAYERAVAALDRARWLGARVLVVAAGVVGEWNAPRPAVRYEDALLYAYNALRALAYEGEARNVMIAVENGWDRFLLSPVEMRELIDHVNSAWIRVSLSVGHALAFGYPQDWIATLGSRIVCVRAWDYRLASGTPAGLCPPGDGDVDWSAVVAALRGVHYGGPVIYAGPGEPAEISRRLDRVLLG